MQDFFLKPTNHFSLEKEKVTDLGENTAIKSFGQISKSVFTKGPHSL